MKLIVFDIDGTLANGTEVPESTQKAIRMTRKKGNLIWICTGRSISYAKRHFHKYANGYILSNGIQGFTCCAKVFDKPFTSEEITEIRKRLDSVNAACVFAGSEGAKFFGNEEGFETLKSIYPDVQKGKQCNIEYNLDVWWKDEEHLEAIKEVLKDMAIVNPHGPHHTVDITILGYDKGEALKRIAEYLNIDMKDVYAFGDGANDVCMLKAAGTGIAMGNALDELKEIADHVTDPINEDGVYNAMQHFGLI